MLSGMMAWWAVKAWRLPHRTKPPPLASELPAARQPHLAHNSTYLHYGHLCHCRFLLLEMITGNFPAANILACRWDHAKPCKVHGSSQAPDRLQSLLVLLIVRSA